MGLSKGVILLLFLTGSLAAVAQPASETATIYSIDSENSVLRVYVGRAGILARMGHNHVVHTRDISGQIILAGDLLESSASFSFPVSSFIVDDQAERDRAGEGFESQPGESAIEGTRENMLGEDVLNAEAFPEIAVTVAPVSVSEDQWLLAAALDFQGSTINLALPARVTWTESSLSVTASFTLDHEDIGLSVFTAVGGSLRVAEEIDFELQIEATAQ